METLFKSAPQIINEAAKSQLGLLALMVIILGVLAFFFFRHASEPTRIATFLIMVIGCAAFGVAIVRVTPSGNSGGDIKPSRPSVSQIKGCLQQYLQGVSSDRVKNVEAESKDAQIVGPLQPKDKPVAIVLMEKHQPVGAIKFQFNSSAKSFKIESIVDSQCQGVENYLNATSGGDKNRLNNWDALEVQFGNLKYRIDFEYDGAISVDTKRIQ